MTTNKPHTPSSCLVTQQDLPLSCPLSTSPVWNAHPRVFLSIETTGRAQCPYCGMQYILREGCDNT